MCHITTMGSNGQPVYTAVTPAQKSAFESSSSGGNVAPPQLGSPSNDRTSFSPEAMAAMGGG